MNRSHWTPPFNLYILLFYKFELIRSVKKMGKGFLPIGFLMHKASWDNVQFKSKIIKSVGFLRNG
jgi:hypothetical protein